MDAGTMTTTVRGWLAGWASPEARRYLALGKEQGWKVGVLGRAPMPDRPVRLGDWLLVPAEQDSSHMPSRAVERARSVFAAGLRPQGFVLAHEAPRLLPGSTQAHVDRWTLSGLPPDLKSMFSLSSGLLALLAIVVAVIAGLIVMALALGVAAFILALPLSLLSGVTLVDPILVAVTEDGYWIELDRWFD